MNALNSREWIRRGGLLSIAAAVLFAIYLLVTLSGRPASGDGINGDGLILGLCRVGFIAGLFAFLLLGARGRLSRIGFGIALVGAGLHLIAALSGVAADGWTYEAFAEEVDTPWYAFLNGAGHGISLLGTLLMGLAALGERVLPPWKAVVPILIGLSFFILASVIGFIMAFLIWSLLWVVLGLAIITEQPRGVQQTEATVPH